MIVNLSKNQICLKKWLEFFFYIFRNALPSNIVAACFSQVFDLFSGREITVVHVINLPKGTDRFSPQKTHIKENTLIMSQDMEKICPIACWPCGRLQNALVYLCVHGSVIYFSVLCLYFETIRNYAKFRKKTDTS